MKERLPRSARNDALAIYSFPSPVTARNEVTKQPQFLQCIIDILPVPKREIASVISFHRNDALIPSLPFLLAMAEGSVKFAIRVGYAIMHKRDFNSLSAYSLLSKILFEY